MEYTDLINVIVLILFIYTFRPVETTDEKTLSDQIRDITSKE